MLLRGGTLCGQWLALARHALPLFDLPENIRSTRCDLGNLSCRRLPMDRRSTQGFEVNSRRRPEFLLSVRKPYGV